MDFFFSVDHAETVWKKSRRVDTLKKKKKERFDCFYYYYYSETRLATLAAVD